MAKIYLAASYAQMLEMRELGERLRSLGHEVTAQWIEGKEANASRESAALMDVEDVRRADTLVLFSFPRGTLVTGGGRHVEFGIALERGMRLLVVGPKGEHVFHSWPGVRFFSSAQELLEWEGL